jgi:cytochrome c oxidase subunit 2
MFTPASPQAEAIRSLTMLVFAITGVIFLVVEGILVYCLVKFRKGDAGETGEPPQVYGSHPIEIAWTAAPALVVFVLVLVTVRTLWQVAAPAPKPAVGDKALFVTVIGRQWWWEYRYDSYDGKPLDFVTANELHIPTSTATASHPVHLILKSADVCHSFWVPELHGKTDLIPGHTNSMTFETAKGGVYLGQCAEYCGTQHANMLIRVHADTPEEFDKWLEHQKTPATAEVSLVAARNVFLHQSCVNCHQVRGTPARGTYAPDLTHLMSRKTLAAGMVPNTPENLKHWVKDPQEIKEGCLMPAFGLTQSEGDDVVKYLLSLN